MDSSLEFDRITHPLRLARGPHRPGSGEGCAMNVVSYLNGDEQITDFPAGSATPLAVLVQASNDLLAGPDGYLSPKNSVLALDLAWQTLGTADVADAVGHAWLAELLTNPQWGVVRYAAITAVKAIRDAAALQRAAAAGSAPSTAEWVAAERAARAVTDSGHRAGRHAVQAAVQSAIGVGDRATLNCVASQVVQAHALAADGDAVSRVVDFSRQAIELWRELAGLNAEGHASVASSAERQASVTPAVGRVPVGAAA